MNDAISSRAGAVAGSAIASTPGSSVAVSGDIRGCEKDWRRLEQSAVVSPYQRYDFIAAWVRNAAAGEGIDARVGTVTDSAGRVVMILPFGVASPALVAVGSYLGGSHVNIAMPLVESTFARSTGR